MHRWSEKPGGHVVDTRNRFHKARHKPKHFKHRMTRWDAFLHSVAQRLTFAWEHPQGWELAA
jgi:hypothetical protein